MKSFNKLVFSILAIISFSACQNQNTSRIVILHTNDTHGKLLNFDKLSYLRDSLLNLYDTVLLVSAGDMFSGNPYVDNHMEPGLPMLDLMNTVGYDLAALGNHEFDYGQKILKDRIEQAHFPFLVGNMSADSGFFDSLNASYIINIEGIKLEFISLIEIQNNGKPSTHPNRIKGINFSEPISQTEGILNVNNDSDAIIGLTHIGYRDDSVLAETYPEFDAIIGGHSHTLIKEQKTINNVLIAQAGENLEHTGLITLTFRNNKLVNKSYKLIDFKTIPAQNTEITELIESYQQNEYLDELLAISKAPLKDRNEIGCFYTDAQKKYHNIDLAFQNYWGIRVNHLSEGPITRKDILELDPFNNEFWIYKMTVAEMKSLIEYSYTLGKSIDLFISGGSYEIVIDNTENISAINMFNQNGKQLDENKTYRVGINSYVTRSYKYDCADEGKNTNTTTSENIIRYLQEAKEIDYSGCERVKVVKK